MVETGDWNTYSGIAGRTVSGTLSAPLPSGAVLELSSDGVSWTTGSITDLSWAATDPLAHTTSWTYQARLVSAEGLVSASVSQEVFLTTPPADFSPQETFTKCLDLIRRFCQRTGLPQPTYVIGNQDIQIAQLMGLLEESQEMLVRRPERGWQVLTREALFVTKKQEVRGSLSDIAPGMIWITDQTISTGPRVCRCMARCPRRRVPAQAVTLLGWLVTAGSWYTVISMLAAV